MKLEQEDVEQICRRVVDHDLHTKLVAEQFEINRRRVHRPESGTVTPNRGFVPSDELSTEAEFTDKPRATMRKVVDFISKRSNHSVLYGSMVDSHRLEGPSVTTLQLKHENPSRRKQNCILIGVYYPPPFPELSDATISKSWSLPSLHRFRSFREIRDGGTIEKA